ncbi:MAG: hypothetical protein Q4C55_01080 [Eubacterium sp.]|nr:hypothetical protein [Eubacterium sp.]
MKRLDPEVIEYYDDEVLTLISEKYGLTPMDALRSFVNSKTHAMLEDADYGMTDFGAAAIFEIWEAEKITGDPRNSIYIRGE